ncbi:D-alanine--D-alanine ligase [Garciella nitratireducens]|uniref:D-alanine--D-alanine ligase n=1 Tax=Garciella nitratireducens DSM 15102 TaxID=1121911 RepID=A0A1T4MGS0_9FIRM|nr:D-alanine--D-alanine ligase [Garciella nitratireducens]SJZ66065.1 D-alanine-D-alanine ligase [Garciella nitratireducens DSM 15102]
MNKKTIAVLFGGQSGEHEVSLMSSSNVIQAMDRQKYDVVMIGITKKGEWMIYTGPVEKIANGDWEKEEHYLIKDFSIHHPIIQSIDVIFPVLHGPMGEDGTVQGLFELWNLPYVGCGVLASALGMDKIYTKTIYQMAGLPQGKYYPLMRYQWREHQNQEIKKIEKELDYPIFIKPANMGSSVGITKAHHRQELVEGIHKACKYDRKILLEESIDCREIECGVLGNDHPKASVLGEILPSNEFYDYHAKYFDNGKSQLVIPAPLDQEIMRKIQDLAIQAFKAIDGSGLARVDFFVEKNTGKIYINEINTLPGFTNISMYPKLWEYSGIPYAKLIDRLIELAIERFEEKTSF